MESSITTEWNEKSRHTRLVVPRIQRDPTDTFSTDRIKTAGRGKDKYGKYEFRLNQIKLIL